MKKHFKLTPVERAMHEQAVKLRKMTDEQLLGCIVKKEGKAYEQGLKTNAKIDKTIERCFGQRCINDFILRLSELCKEGNGIGPATVAKLRKIAENEGFLPVSEAEIS